MLTTTSLKSRRLHLASRTGFTLVELLVVIGIIAILASVVAVAAGPAIASAKRAKMATLGNQLQTAILNYYTEYSVYPVDPAAGAVDTFYGKAGADWQPITVALAGGIDLGNPAGGIIAGNVVPNTRQIPFLSLTRQDLDTTLVPAVPKTPFKDSKGATQYFQMAVDSDYSNILGDSGANTMPPDFSSIKSSDTTLPGGKELSAGVAIWANGDPSATAGGSTHPNLWTHTY